MSAAFFCLGQVRAPGSVPGLWRVESIFSMAHLRLIAVLIQFVVASGASVPWDHDHAELSLEQLAAHLQQCHQGSSQEELPRGRHVHVSVFDAIVDGETDGRSLFDVAPVETLIIDFDLALVRFDSGLASSSDLSREHVRPDGILACFAATSGCELFQAYGALRI